MSRPLRIAVDARALNNTHIRGMGKCLWQLIAGSPADCEWMLFSDRPDLPFHRPPHARVNVTLRSLAGYRFRSWEQLMLPWASSRAKPDLLFCPATTVPFLQPVPTVVIIHDAIPWLQQEEGWPAGFHRDRVLPAAYRKCARVITISQGSKADILSLWPDLEPTIRVVPNGVSDAYLTARRSDCQTPLDGLTGDAPYLLYLGGTNPRKRLQWALDVFMGLSRSDVSLVICGIEPDMTAAIRDSVPAPYRNRLVIPAFVDEASMPCLYSRAAAVLYPTRYEGFGLPALEAQAVGTPVVFSPVNGLTELRGPSARVVELDDLGAWVGATENVLSEWTPGAPPNQAAREWAANFSWSNYVRRMLDVFVEAIGKPRSASGTTG